MLKIIVLFFTFNAYAIPSAGDLALYQIAANTLNSVRELNSLINDTREFSENFERVYRKVDTAVWKADRTAMWIEELQALSQEKAENHDELIFILQRIKFQTRQLKDLLIKEEKKRQELENIEKVAEDEEKRDKRELRAAILDTSSEVSPNVATVEIAKNTKELVIAIHRQNIRINRLTKAVTSMADTVIKERQEKIAQKESDTKVNNPLKKGVITKRDLK